MTSARINGIDLHYQVYGEGETVVFAHGAGGNLLSWWQQIPFFSRRFQCVTFDQRGFGHSLDEPEGPGSSAFVDDLEGLLDHLGVQQAHLIAQSMGGRTMLGFAVAFPQRTKSLVMADTVGGMAVDAVTELHREWRENHQSSEGIGTAALSNGFKKRNPELANLYLQVSSTNPPRQQAGFQGSGPTAEQLADVKTPTMFIVGEDDQLSPPQVIEAAAATIPGSKVLRVPEAGHSVYFEQPEVFNFEVLRFIESSG